MDWGTVCACLLLPSVGFAVSVTFAAWWRGRRERRVLEQARRLVQEIEARQ